MGKVYALERNALRHLKNVIEQMKEAWFLALEDPRFDLESDARAFGINEEMFEVVLNVLLNRDPRDVIREFAKRNPHMNWRRLHEHDAYEVALGMLRAYLRSD